MSGSNAPFPARPGPGRAPMKTFCLPNFPSLPCNNDLIGFSLFLPTFIGCICILSGPIVKLTGWRIRACLDGPRCDVNSCHCPGLTSGKKVPVNLSNSHLTTFGNQPNLLSFLDPIPNHSTQQDASSLLPLVDPQRLKSPWLSKYVLQDFTPLSLSSLQLVHHLVE